MTNCIIQKGTIHIHNNPCTNKINPTRRTRSRNGGTGSCCASTLQDHTMNKHSLSSNHTQILSNTSNLHRIHPTSSTSSIQTTSSTSLHHSILYLHPLLPIRMSCLHRACLLTILLRFRLHNLVLIRPIGTRQPFEIQRPSRNVSI